MATWTQIAKQLGSLKVKDVPTFVRGVVTRENVERETTKFLKDYHQKYIVTGSITPLNQLMAGVFVLSYAVGWPAEIRHMRHAEEAKRSGGEHH